MSNLFSKEELADFLAETEDRLKEEGHDAKAIKELSRKEFLDWLSSLKEELALNIKEASLNLPPEQREQRVARAAKDVHYFAETYLPHYLTIKGKSELHEELEKIFLHLKKVRGKKYAVAAPRANAKTTYVCVIFVLWVIAFKLRRFIVEISDAIELVEANLESVKAELEENPALALDFPHIVGPTKNWKVGEFVTKNGIKLKAFGSKKRIRGIKYGAYRVDLALIDDLENDENVRSKTQRDKLEEWLDEAVANLGTVDRLMDTFYIGSILHKDSVLARKLKKAFWNPKIFRSLISYPVRIDLWDTYTSLYINKSIEEAHKFYLANKESMDAGAKVLWESALPLEKLMQIRAENLRAFNKEQQNNPQDGLSKFSEAKMHFYTREPKYDLVYLYCDPAGNNKKSDFTAITVLGVNKQERRAYILESIVAIMSAQEIIATIIKLYKKYRFTKGAVETNGGQFFLKGWLLQAAFDAGVHMPIKGVHNRDSKEDRVMELELPIENGEIVFSKEHRLLISQLEDFPEGDHDDAPDSLHGCYKLTKIEKTKNRGRRRHNVYSKTLYKSVYS
jgi:predicted phage terminase large subunit-like protein